MPELSRFMRIIIRMLYKMEQVQHKKPHIHVYYGEYEASIGIDGELLADSLPVKQLKLINARLVIHEEECSLFGIKPLEVLLICSIILCAELKMIVVLTSV